MLTFHTRRPLIDACIKALKEGRASIVSCGDEDSSYAEHGLCRVYITGSMIVGAKFIVREC